LLDYSYHWQHADNSLIVRWIMPLIFRISWPFLTISTLHLKTSWNNQMNNHCMKF
jgi:hypothetical protein